MVSTNSHISKNNIMPYYIVHKMFIVVCLYWLMVIMCCNYETKDSEQITFTVHYFYNRSVIYICFYIIVI
jgi:hypothetical protein